MSLAETPECRRDNAVSESLPPPSVERPVSAAPVCQAILGNGFRWTLTAGANLMNSSELSALALPAFGETTSPLRSLQPQRCCRGGFQTRVDCDSTSGYQRLEKRLRHRVHFNLKMLSRRLYDIRRLRFHEWLQAE